MIRLSVKGLAKYMTASPANQRKILREFKFPDEAEAMAMRSYYREAGQFISAYHRNSHEAEWLRQKASDIAGRGAAQSGPSAVRLTNNARAVRQYADHFGERRFDLLPVLRLHLDQADVRISCVADLHVRERGREKLIKLDYGAKAPSEQAVKIISQALFEVAHGSVADLTSASILYFDVRRGDEYKGSRAGARMTREIGAACQTISTLWNSIERI